MADFREASKGQWTSAGDVDHINAGSLQRIADASETMAKNFLELQRDRDWWKSRAEDRARTITYLGHSIRSLRGVITRLKRRKAEEARE